MFKHISPSPFYPRRDYEITANRERDVNKKICIHENNVIFINLFESSLRGAFFESIVRYSINNLYFDSNANYLRCFRACLRFIKLYARIRNCEFVFVFKNCVSKLSYFFNIISDLKFFFFTLVKLFLPFIISIFVH